MHDIFYVCITKLILVLTNVCQLEDEALFISEIKRVEYFEENLHPMRK